MFNLFRRSKRPQENLFVRAEDLKVGDRLLYNTVVEEVVAIHGGAKMAHVILRPIRPESAVTLDEYHEEVLYLELIVLVTRF